MSTTSNTEATVSATVADLETDSLLDRFPQGLRLVGTRCQACGQTMIGSRVVCSTCVSRDVERVALPSTGTLYSFTRLHVKGRPVRALGYVDLDDSVRTLTDLREPADGLRPDQRVELGVDGDEWFFEPASGQ